MALEERPGDRPRNAWELIFSRAYGTFLTARLATAVGTWLHTVVAAIAIFESTNSALFVGIVSAVQFAPQIALGPVAGRWSDQGSIKFQMILGRALLSISALALAVWYFCFGDLGGTANAVAVLATSLIFGFGLLIGGPGMQTAGPILAARSELPTATALNTAPMTIGRLAGPALGAFSVAWLGYSFAFLLAAVLSLAFIAMVARITFPTAPGHIKGERLPFRDAARFVVHDRPTLLALIGVTAVGLGSEPVITLAPALGSKLGGDSHTIGAFVTAMGVGAGIALILSSTFARKLHPEVIAFAGILVMAVSLGVCALDLSEQSLWVTFGATGFGFIVAQGGLTTIVQLRMPPLLRGRIMAIWLVGFLGSRPLGSILAGTLADTLSVYVAFAAVGVLMLIVALVGRPSQLRG